MLIEYKHYRPFVNSYKYNMRKTKLNINVKHIALNRVSEVYVCIKASCAGAGAGGGARAQLRRGPRAPQESLHTYNTNQFLHANIT